MAEEKRDKDLTIKILELRKKAREKVKEELLKEYEKCKIQGTYPWEGIWLSPRDIGKVQERMKKRDKVVFVEVSTFFFVFGLFTYGLYRLMKGFLLP